jgi:4-hydroxybenzoyl-CoA reductase subunit beta
MNMPRFEYLEPTSLQEAGLLLREHGKQAAILAGGTDLMVRMKQRTVTPGYLVKLQGLSDLDGISDEERGGLRAGVLTTLHTLAASPAIRAQAPILAQAARRVASPQIRYLATLGGNLCLERRCWYYNQSAFWRQAHPPCFRTGGDKCHVVKGGDTCYALLSADTVPALLALGAEVKVVGLEGEAVMPLERLYPGLGLATTTLTAGDILVEVRLPLLPAGTCMTYCKQAVRGALDFPLINVAVVLIAEDGCCREAHIVVGAVCPFPVRAGEAEALLRERPLDERTIRQAAQAAASEVKPIPYIYQPPAEKRRLVAVLVEEAIREAWTTSVGGSR